MMKFMPCPFCQDPEEDTGGACCFCDYQGEVSIGFGGMFDSIEQYDKIRYAANHQSKLDELHGRNQTTKLDQLY